MISIIKANITFWLQVIYGSFHICPFPFNRRPLNRTLIKVAFGIKIISLPNRFGPFTRLCCFLWSLVEITWKIKPLQWLKQVFLNKNKQRANNSTYLQVSNCQQAFLRQLYLLSVEPPAQDAHKIHPRGKDYLLVELVQPFHHFEQRLWDVGKNLLQEIDYRTVELAWLFHPVVDLPLVFDKSRLQQSMHI